MQNKSQSFIELVQQHEREWGTDSYPQRPTLADLLGAPVVAWWRREDDTSETRLIATVHEDIDVLNKYATRLLLHSSQAPIQRRLAMVYIHQKRASIRGVSVHIVEGEG